MPLTREEREAFLAEPHVAALSVDAGPGRAPLTVPIWYQYRPGENPWILTPAESRKAKLITAAGRFSLMVDTVHPRVRYVSVEGPAAAVQEADEAAHRELATRYLPAGAVEEYVAMARRDFGRQLVIHLRPQRWLSADLTMA
ncbi:MULTISPECIES: pyridoxamine 5'-phosphate oxidase family protein [Thermocrispum]|jgi:nitroimidazol reductase NimA-like FMN-containing flavoprotein (pyridoxamine 5'-phosphate oxidase superfamily)|uniref:Pyridoxamine 5'-phosphate oxidase n=1 Tax=Thermocrispum agreste TaxID=37925 RepID=A0A2W4JHY7_9PSEU|nr:MULTISPECIES: pyridoxamine 5'-phosphate oxidase family protein [Thermocrispum]PZM98660.1 MAG: pyridoxamine 5'-phosphate oxidase [Thermocrispum agreste]